MVGDGTWLTVREASSRLGVSPQTARNYAADDLLYVYRLAGRHRRFEAASVDALMPLLRMPLGPERDEALEKLRRANRARAAGDAAGPAGEQQGQQDSE